MPLTTALRQEVMAELAALLSKDGPVTPTKAEILAAAAGIDDYYDANAVQMNAAIPQPARGALTTPQKAALGAYVMLRRWGG